MAFKRLTDNPKFKSWLKIKSIHEQEIQDIVKEAMKPDNLKVEIFTNGIWSE